MLFKIRLGPEQPVVESIIVYSGQRSNLTSGPRLRILPLSLNDFFCLTVAVKRKAEKDESFL